MREPREREEQIQNLAGEISTLMNNVYDISPKLGTQISAIFQAHHDDIVLPTDTNHDSIFSSSGTEKIQRSPKKMNDTYLGTKQLFDTIRTKIKNSDDEIDINKLYFREEVNKFQGKLYEITDVTADKQPRLAIIKHAFGDALNNRNINTINRNSAAVGSVATRRPSQTRRPSLNNHNRAGTLRRSVTRNCITS